MVEPRYPKRAGAPSILAPYKDQLTASLKAATPTAANASAPREKQTQKQ